MEAAEAPPGAVTVTSTSPVPPAGAQARIWPSPSTSKFAAAVPKSTATAPEKPLPRIVTAAPAPPIRGETPLTTATGVGSTHVKRSGAVLVEPAGPLTLTTAVPSPGGATASIRES